MSAPHEVTTDFTLTLKCHLAAQDHDFALVRKFGSLTREYIVLCVHLFGKVGNLVRL